MQSTCVSKSLLDEYDQCKLDRDSEVECADDSECTYTDDVKCTEDAKSAAEDECTDENECPEDVCTKSHLQTVDSDEIEESDEDSDESDILDDHSKPCDEHGGEHATEYTKSRVDTLDSDDSDSDSDDSDAQSGDSDDPSDTCDENADEHTLEDALRSMHQDVGTIWLIRNSNGSVGYARATSGIISYFERVLESYQHQYGWESRVHIEWNLKDEHGLAVEFWRTVIQRTNFILHAANILETYNILPCNPIQKM